MLQRMCTVSCSLNRQDTWVQIDASIHKEVVLHWNIQMCLTHRHLSMVCVLQSKIVSFCQVEMVTNKVKEHFTRRPWLQQGKENGRHGLKIST